MTELPSNKDNPFELHPDNVRDYLRKKSEEVSSCVVQESRVGKYQDFVKFEIKGPAGTANLVVVVNAEAESFEFSVGHYMHYEGDYPAPPRTLDFLDDLVDAVMRGNVVEWRYFFISPRISKASKVAAEVHLSRHQPFRFTQWFSFFSFLAQKKSCHQYLPYL